MRTLTTCYRSREAVLSSALAIREGNVPPNYTKSYSEFYEFVSLADARKAHDFILRQVKNGEIDFAEDVILCCRNGETVDEPLSVKSLNADIKAIVNPGDGKIDARDRIICTVNSSDLDVWNGTTGRCACFDSSRAMWVELDFPNADGETSVLIYPHGARPDGNDWHNTGEAFRYLHSKGFRVFASVGINSFSYVKDDISAVICDRLHPDGTTFRKSYQRYLQFYDAREIMDIDVRPDRGVNWE